MLAAAIGGGSYEGRVDATCDRHCVARLVVVDDGRSPAAESIVAPPCDLAETPNADSEQAPRGTPVHADGAFRWQTRFQVVEGVACRAGRSQIELVIRRACGGPGPVQGYTSRAINVDCAVAASVARQWSRQGDCGRRSCTVAGWRCGRPTGTPRTTHCLRAHAAVEIQRRIIIED